MPKEKGGLWIKDIASFNKYLLLKWKWRFITAKIVILKGIVEHRYSSSSLALEVMRYDGAGGQNSNSIWWRDISSLSYDKVISSYFFVDNLSFPLGDGMEISFWHCKWSNKIPLNEAFPKKFFTLHFK